MNVPRNYIHLSSLYHSSQVLYVAFPGISSVFIASYYLLLCVDYDSVRPVHTPYDVVRQPLCDNGRRRPLSLDLGVDFKSRLKSTWEFGVGSGRFHLGSESNFSGVVCLFTSRFFLNIWLFFATLRASSQMNESLFCVRVTASVRRTWIKTTKYQYWNFVFKRVLFCCFI